LSLLKVAKSRTTSTKTAVQQLVTFLKINPSVSVRKPEATSINSIAGFSKTEVTRFYYNLEEAKRNISFHLPISLTWIKPGFQPFKILVLFWLQKDKNDLAPSQAGSEA
jgi:hypothetical protein